MPTTYESRTIAAPVSQVWAALADLEAAARWNHAWRRVEYLSDQREGEGTAFRAHTEDGLAHDFTISAWAPPQHIAFAPVRDEAEGRYMITLESQAFHLQPDGEDRTHVNLFATAAGHGPRGWLLARFVWPSYQRQGLRSALDALQALFEPPEEEGEDAPDSSGGQAEA
jgi:uncharacterized protein YndB with AHSA1/START domain